MTAEEQDALFVPNEATQRPTVPPPPPLTVVHHDTASSNGLAIERPDMFDKKYDTQPSEQVHTGQNGVLDAKWTVGGRIKGRENIETASRISDLEAWADSLAALAESKVAEARTDREKTLEQADKLSSNVAAELQQANEANQRQAHEAEKAAALALQWKEYSEQVKEQAEKQQAEAAEALKAAMSLRDEAERAALQPQTPPAASPDDPADTRYVLRNGGFASNIMFALLAATLALSSYALFFTDVILDLSARKPPQPVTALLYAHVFFVSHTCIAAISSTLAQDFGAIILCSPSGISSAVVYLLYLAYMILLAASFLGAKYSVEWRCRLVQLIMAFIIADFKVQTLGHCDEEAVVVSGTSFGKQVMPFYVSCVLFSFSLILEVKIVENSMYYSEGYGAEGDDDGEGEDDKAAARDKELEKSLYSLLEFKLDGITGSAAVLKKDEAGEVDESAARFDDDKELGEMKASDTITKRRR
jgi:hypothetical protein